MRAVGLALAPTTSRVATGQDASRTGPPGLRTRRANAALGSTQAVVSHRSPRAAPATASRARRRMAVS